MTTPCASNGFSVCDNLVAALTLKNEKIYCIAIYQRYKIK